MKGVLVLVSISFFCCSLTASSFSLTHRVGGGAQASVWGLASPTGAPLPLVLKHAHPAATAVAPIEREWAVGWGLNALGVAGFVRTGERPVCGVGLQS